MSCHLFLFKNISKNLRSMPHHLSPLKNISKNLRKPSQATPLFPIEK
jgi:hypothetical protein